jgi:CubicO group peptidase (beta-lactamase class C family)
MDSGESKDFAATAWMNRRQWLGAATATLAVTTLTGLLRSESGAAAAAPSAPAPVAQVPAALQRFIQEYMSAMNAPGLTLGLANRAGSLATGAYGYADLAAKIPITTAQLFQIGSISKSFAALVILQLQDEGKLDVQLPVLRYLPWLPIETDYGEILIHHLLTHSSGMPDDPPLFSGEPAARVRQTFKPGTQFHYSNWGFDVLGHVIESLDGVSWPVAVSRRILAPLGMTQTAAAITSNSRPRIAQSYLPLYEDRPYPRHGALAVAGPMSFLQASGSIAAPPLDMTRYMHLLLNLGVGPSGRLVSKEAFAAFSTPHIAAEEFGPGASYGYGIAIDTLDGHKRLRHTGGMVSFMSAMHVDLDAGLGAFASINAQQGYRPNPVAQYGLQVLRAASERKAPPPAPRADPSAELADAAGYAGVYTAPNGRSLTIAADNAGLVLLDAGQRIPLQAVGADQFIAGEAPFDLYPLVFGRAAVPTTPASAPPAAAPPAALPPVVELGFGPDWFANARYTGDRSEPAAPQLAPYAGLYYNADPWAGATRIVLRRGRLWAGGALPLEPIGEHLFRWADEPSSPETAEFRDLVGGHAQVLLFDGAVLKRIADV